MFDAAQNFGLVVSRMAMASQSVQSAVLALASTSMRAVGCASASVDSEEAKTLAMLCRTNQEENLSVKELLTSSVLYKLWCFLADIPVAWENGSVEDPVLWTFENSMRYSRMESLESSLYFLSLRLGT